MSIRFTVSAPHSREVVPGAPGMCCTLQKHTKSFAIEATISPGARWATATTGGAALMVSRER